MKRSLIRHDGLYNDRMGRFYSIVMERLPRRQFRVLTLAGRKYYGRVDRRVAKKIAYEGPDERKAHRARERVYAARMRSGYQHDRALYATPVREHLARAGGRHDELYTELARIAPAPEIRATTPLPGHLVAPTLRGRTLRRFDRRSNYAVPNGRSWLCSEPSGLRIISQGRDFEHWNALLPQSALSALERFAPFIIEGSHGAIAPATRPYMYDEPEFLPEDLVKIRGEHVGDLPYTERRALLDELLAAIDAIGPVNMVIPAAIREQLADEAELAARTGTLLPGAQALPLLRRLDAQLDDERARIVLTPPVKQTEPATA